MEGFFNKGLGKNINNKISIHPSYYGYMRRVENETHH
jgi:hypothetical protein